MLLSSIFVFVSSILPFTLGSTHGHLKRDRHQELAQRARGDVGIHKRAFANARFTFYDVGLGACGQYSSPGDFIVALNVAQYGGGYPGPQCFKSITISYGGKTAQATIMDECMGCPYAGLDFSTGLFNYFASPDDGVVYGTWWFNDGTSEPTSSSSSEWTPTPTPTPAYTPPTPTWTPPTTTYQSTTSTTTVTTTTSSSSSISTTSMSNITNITNTTSTSSINYSSGAASGIVVPTGTAVVPAPESGSPQNILVLNQAIINIGILLTSQRGN